MSSIVAASLPSLVVSDGSTDSVSHPLDNVVTVKIPPAVPLVSHCGTSKGTCAQQDCNCLASFMTPILYVLHAMFSVLMLRGVRSVKPGML